MVKMKAMDVQYNHDSFIGLHIHILQKIAGNIERVSGNIILCMHVSILELVDPCKPIMNGLEIVSFTFNSGWVNQQKYTQL